MKHRWAQADVWTAGPAPETSPGLGELGKHKGPHDRRGY
jgi:hypothetical protein